MAPKVSFDRTALIQHLEDFKASELRKLDESIAAMRDNRAFEQELGDWRALSKSKILVLAEKITNGTVTDAEITTLRIDPIPSPPSSWDKHEARRQRERVEKKYSRIVGVIKAAKTDEFTYADLRTMGLLDLVKVSE